MGRPWARAIAVLLVAMAGCRAEPPVVPAPLLHVWRTQAPAYRDRHLEIRRDMLVFGTSAYLSELYPIERVEAEPAEEGGTQYTIHYRAQDGGRLQLRLTLWRGKPDRLRIEHIDDIWRADVAPAHPQKGA